MRPAVAFTAVALLAFAGNSLLARAAIGPGADGEAALGPIAFTALRLAAGALVLWPWWRPRPGAPSAWDRGSGWPRRAAGAVALVVYAVPFSVAYVALGAGTGALLLFGAAQVTMLGAGLWSGERFGVVRVAGLIAAAAGVVVLVAPGLQAPPAAAAAAMLFAGVAWGAYSLIGRAPGDPAAATARNFALALPAAAVLALWPGAWDGATLRGVALAIVCGAATTGLGYVAWYRAVPALSRSAASVVQLSVPPLTALIATATLGEAPGPRWFIASALVLGGIAAVLIFGGRGAGGGRRGA